MLGTPGTVNHVNWKMASTARRNMCTLYYWPQEALSLKRLLKGIWLIRALCPGLILASLLWHIIPQSAQPAWEDLKGQWRLASERSSGFCQKFKDAAKSAKINWGKECPTPQHLKAAVEFRVSTHVRQDTNRPFTWSGTLLHSNVDFLESPVTSYS